MSNFPSKEIILFYFVIYMCLAVLQPPIETHNMCIPNEYWKKLNYNSMTLLIE